MNKIRAIALTLLIATAMVFSYSGTAAASTLDDTIYNYLSGEISFRIQRVYSLIERVEQAFNGRFDSIDTKLDRVYAACGGVAAPARRATLAQASTCIDSCFTTTATSTFRNGALGTRNGVIDSDRFVACVSRCPSNTLRNQECAQRYVRSTESQEQFQSFGPYIMMAHNRDGFSRVCANSRDARFTPSCQAYADSLVSGLGSCLIDQQVYLCQQDCDANFRNAEVHMQCTLRCNNRVRAAEIYNNLRESGFINEQGRLSVDTTTNTTINPIVPAPAAPTPPTPPPAPPQTYTQCVYGCDSERTSCLVQTPLQPAMCQAVYDRCYAGCSTRL